MTILAGEFWIADIPFTKFVLKNGLTVIVREQHATPLEVLTRPATTYVEQLLETHDRVRRLSLITAGQAAVVRSVTADGSIDADANLRDALNAFLDGAQCLAVERASERIGTLQFDDVRAALRA